MGVRLARQPTSRTCSNGFGPQRSLANRQALHLTWLARAGHEQDAVVALLAEGKQHLDQHAVRSRRIGEQQHLDVFR